MEEKTLLIKNGHVIDPASNRDSKMDVLIKGNKIVDMSIGIQSDDSGFLSSTDNLVIVDASDKIVVPGLIDCHVHFREPGFENKETILTGTKAAAKGGFTSVICEPNTNPTIDTPEMVDRLMEIAYNKAVVHLYTKVCMTKGSLGKEVTDIESLGKKECVLAISDDGNPVTNEEVVKMIFSAAKDANIAVSPHCEDSPQSLNQKLNGSRFSNPPYTNESNFIARDIEFAEKIGAQLHISHVSLKESVNIIRKAKDRNLASITCEVTPHHLILNNEFVDINGIKPKVNPPLRSDKDVVAVREGLTDGTIDVIASDHAPHTLQDKEKGGFGIIGLETTFGLIISEIVRNGILSLKDAIQKMSYNPALIFGINAGRLSVGMPADITIIDLKSVWIVDSTNFESKSENCPFHGRQLNGKVCATIVSGKIVMKDGKLC